MSLKAGVVPLFFSYVSLSFVIMYFYLLYFSKDKLDRPFNSHDLYPHSLASTKLQHQAIPEPWPGLGLRLPGVISWCDRPVSSLGLKRMGCWSFRSSGRLALVTAPLPRLLCSCYVAVALLYTYMTRVMYHYQTGHDSGFKVSPAEVRLLYQLQRDMGNWKRQDIWEYPYPWMVCSKWISSMIFVKTRT